MIIGTPSAEVLAYTQLPPIRTIKDVHEIEGPIKGKIVPDDACSELAMVVERCGRVSWKSEGKIEPGSADGFITRVVHIRKDQSIAEHASVTMLLVTDRYTTHQLVRHRIAAYTQESTHYIDYSKRGDHPGQIVVMEPLGIEKGTLQWDIWKIQCERAEAAYFELLRQGVKHYHARFALPSCLKTEIAVTFNLRMWLHVLELRTTPNNTPEIVHVMKLAGHEMAKLCPEMFSKFELYEKAVQTNHLSSYKEGQ